MHHVLICMYIQVDLKFSAQGLLDSQALEMLIDSSLTALDIANSQVTDAALQNALQTTPNLLSLDVTGCQVSQRTVRSLGTWCPQLQVLRLGWSDCYHQFIFCFSVHSKLVLEFPYQDRCAINNAPPFVPGQHTLYAACAVCWNLPFRRAIVACR